MAMGTLHTRRLVPASLLALALATLAWGLLALAVPEGGVASGVAPSCLAPKITKVTLKATGRKNSTKLRESPIFKRNTACPGVDG